MSWGLPQLFLNGNVSSTGVGGFPQLFLNGDVSSTGVGDFSISVFGVSSTGLGVFPNSVNSTLSVFTGVLAVRGCVVCRIDGPLPM